MLPVRGCRGMETERKGVPVTEVRVDREELAELTLTLCNIDSPPGRELEAAEFVHDWMKANDLAPRRVGMFPDRFNVLGQIRGRGDGYSLIFNSHLDTGHAHTDVWSMRRPDAAIHHRAWREGDTLFGEGVVNDKGPLAAFLMAAKTIRQAGIELKGDLLLSAVVGEIGTEPIDEFESPEYLSKEAGTRYLIQHGGVADYALNAEGTDFRYASIEAGKAFFKVTVYGADQIYTPFVPLADADMAHPNAIVRAALLVPALQEWGNRYTERNTYRSDGGTVVPKVVIGAIRGGNPYHVTRTSELCSLYLDVRLVPASDPLQIRQELDDLLEQQGLEGDVELFVYRRSYEAGDTGPFLESLRLAHEGVLGGELELADTPISSMWRDLSIFNEMGIPSITYGPPRAITRQAVELEELVRTADVYARLALDLCNQTKPRDRAAAESAASA
jgi:acetylornithine deacetylase/succinyl-diaminopimelate desuccinylase-like protein